MKALKKIATAMLIILSTFGLGCSSNDNKSIPSKVISSSEKVFKVTAVFKITRTGSNFSFFQFFGIPDTADKAPKVRIEEDSLFGSGFVCADNFFVTADHVVNPEKFPVYSLNLGLFEQATIELRSVVVYSSDGKKYNARFLRSDKGNDVAILHLGNVCLGGLSLNVKEPKKFDRLWVAGYPNADNGVVVTPPQVFYNIGDSVNTNPQSPMGLMVKKGHRKIMRLSGGSATGHGISGGPILDKDGKVVGIITNIDFPFGNMSYATPAEFIWQILYYKKK